MSRLRKFLGLPSRDRARLGLYSLFLPAISLALRLFGFRRLYRFIALHPRPDPGSAPIPVEVLEKAKHTAALVSIAARHGPCRAACLRQSLLLTWILRHQGLPSDLRIEVQKRAGRILAHAWVRLGDTVISEAVDPEVNFRAFEGIS